MATTKKKKTYTRVVFRVFKHGIGKGEVIALFIDEIENNRGEVMSYMHVGQHSLADYRGVVAISRPATPEEVEPLISELHRIGYSNIEIMKRMHFPKNW